jgi:hypothetical protein
MNIESKHSPTNNNNCINININGNENNPKFPNDTNSSSQNSSNQNNKSSEIKIILAYIRFDKIKLISEIIFNAIREFF